MITFLEGGYYLGMAITVLAYGWSEDRPEFWAMFLIGGALMALLYREDGRRERFDGDHFHCIPIGIESGRGAASHQL